ncbi:cadherin domain-containing protein, partial [Allorhodopirellula solitaria]|uniref:cadherin domain-containing protein n=1 Tax=Allorhodopirellula solitaria TaxID=2527987 RepID=UPI001FE6A3DB
MQSLENRRVLAASIAAFEPSASGFTAEFSEQINTDNLNLFDTEGQAAGAADVVLHGASTGNVLGSFVVDGTSLAFVASDGALEPDTYTATLRSADDAFTDLDDGELLDGDNDGTAGGDFVTSFTVDASPGVSVELPGIVRGPGQALQTPDGGSGAGLEDGLPIRLSQSEGVTSLTMTIHYDPSMLDISDVQLGSDAPEGSQVYSNLTDPGTATVSFFSIDPLTADQTDFLKLVASVPEDATYGSSQVVHISDLDVNAGAMDAVASDSLQVVAYLGDVNGNERYDAEDARLVARVGVGLDTGFVYSDPTSTTPTNRLFPTIDPVLIGDVTGADGLSPLDSSDILRRVVGLPTPNLPEIPDSGSTEHAPTDVALSNDSIDESSAVGTVVGTLTSTDVDAGDSFTYALVEGEGDADNAAFTIDGDELKTAAALDFDTQSSYSVRVSSTDSSGLSVEKVLTISVTETAENTAPTAIALSETSIDESSEIGTAVGTLSSTDADAGDTFTYALVAGEGDTDNAAFEIDGDEIKTVGELDFDTQSSYSVRVSSTDAGGLSTEETFTITVTEAAENTAPTAIALSETSIDESSEIGTAVGTLSSTDADAGDTFTYALVAGEGDTDNAAFEIDGDQIKTVGELDFDTQSSYSVRVSSTDAGGLSTEEMFTITVTEAAENTAPTAIALSETSIDESSEIGTAVGTLSSTDANVGDTFTYALVAGEGDTDNAAFEIDGDQIKTVGELDFDTQSSYSVRV